MRYSSKVIGMAALAMVAGCSVIEQPKAPPPIGASTAPAGNICNTQGAQWAVGKSATAKVLEEARVRAGARMARVLHPGQPATMEFDAQRLNLMIDAGGKVKSANCG